jgi:hypothetical protein
MMLREVYAPSFTIQTFHLPTAPSAAFTLPPRPALSLRDETDAMVCINPCKRLRSDQFLLGNAGPDEDEPVYGGAVPIPPDGVVKA